MPVIRQNGVSGPEPDRRVTLGGGRLAIGAETHVAFATDARDEIRGCRDVRAEAFDLGATDGDLSLQFFPLLGSHRRPDMQARVDPVRAERLREPHPRTVNRAARSQEGCANSKQRPAEREENAAWPVAGIPPARPRKVAARRRAASAGTVRMGVARGGVRVALVADQATTEERTRRFFP